MAFDLKRADINDMLKPFGEVEIETGIFKNRDGNWCIHMLSPMPCAPGYRVNWWTSRGMCLPGNFQRWNPTEHTKPMPPEKLKDINDPKQWYPNMFYSTANHVFQEIGGQKQEIQNRYYYPEEFGFDISKFEEAGVTLCNCTSPQNEDCALYGQQLIHVNLETDYGSVRRTWLYTNTPNKTYEEMLGIFNHMFYENSSICQFLNEAYEADPQNKGRKEVYKLSDWKKPE